MIMPVSRFAAFLLLAAIGLHAGAALAQAYPSKPVRIVVPFAPGGTLDTIARVLGQKLVEAWNQPVLIENRGGSGGIIGADAVAKAAPDGHTLLMTTSGLALSPSLYRRLPFDALKDFAPVSEICASHLTLVANSNLRAMSAGELIALARSRPGSLNYGHTGAGSNQQLTMELFKKRTGIDIRGIPYKGAAPVSTALMTGEVDVAFVPAEMALAYIKAGKLRALAVTSRMRSPQLPEVPTMAEAGMQDFGLPGWNGLLAPAGTPRAIVEAVQRESAKILLQPDVRDRIVAMGLVPVGSMVDEFEAKYKSDIATYARIVAEMGIPLQN